jgi:hypothetical protein
VVSVGCIKSGAGIKWSVFRNVVFSWLVTLPVAGLISAGHNIYFKKYDYTRFFRYYAAVEVHSPLMMCAIY